MHKADIGIIGAGVVGCAIAENLISNQKEKTITVIEAHSQPGMETSRFNSGVNHSGFHQEPGSLKAKLALRGSQLMERYIKENLPPGAIVNCGMMIAISDRDLIQNIFSDIPSLIHLWTRGSKQGISFKVLGPGGVKEVEPNIRAVGGIFIPQVSVIDSIAVTKSLWENSKNKGVDFFFNKKARDIQSLKGGYLVSTGSDQFFFKCLINSAGLYADEVSSLAGVNKYKIYPWRGEYFELKGLPDDYVRTLVYPAVGKNSPGKGIHFRPLMNDKVLIGPSAMPVQSKEDYDNNRLAKEVFLKAAQKFFPEIKEENLAQSYAGIRPKLSSDGKEDDFIISLDRLGPPLINLVGIESPGLSASLGIAEYVADIINQISI